MKFVKFRREFPFLQHLGRFFRKNQRISPHHQVTLKTSVQLQAPSPQCYSSTGTQRWVAGHYLEKSNELWGSPLLHPENEETPWFVGSNLWESGESGFCRKENLGIKVSLCQQDMVDRILDSLGNGFLVQRRRDINSQFHNWNCPFNSVQVRFSEVHVCPCYSKGPRSLAIAAHSHLGYSYQVCTTEQLPSSDAVNLWTLLIFIAEHSASE